MKSLANHSSNRGRIVMQDAAVDFSQTQRLNYSALFEASANQAFCLCDFQFTHVILLIQALTYSPSRPSNTQSNAQSNTLFFDRLWRLFFGNRDFTILLIHLLGNQ